MRSWQKHGYRPERRLYAHGQGYDLVERPLIREDEPMKIKAGMNITVHPGAANERSGGRSATIISLTRPGRLRGSTRPRKRSLFYRDVIEARSVIFPQAAVGLNDLFMETK